MFLIIDSRACLFLFPVEDKPQRNYSERASWGNYRLTGDNHIHSPNEINGLAIYYYLGEAQSDTAWVEIYNDQDSLVDSLELNQERGFQIRHYDTEAVVPGIYKVVLTDGVKKVQRNAKVLPSPIWQVGYGVENK